jgi:CheY-like chemotaxis protein
MTSTRTLGLQATILVVEDEVLIRMVISDYLRQCGYKVIEAANGDEAVVVLEKRDINIDVVFSDIELSGSRDGFALSRWVRAHRPGVEVILTGSISRAANLAGDLCEKGPHLKKPYEPASVQDQIKRLLAAEKRTR